MKKRPSRTGPPPVQLSGAATLSWTVAFWAVLALGLIFAARRLADADLGYHLQGGRWILQRLQFPSTDTFTYTRTAAEYIDLHWLFQVLIYGAYLAGGYMALSIVTILLLAAVFGVTWVRVRLTGVPLFMSVALLAIAVLSSELRFQLRPELLTWLFMSAMLLVLEQRARTGQSRWLFLLPIIQLVWTNSEGLFGIGWGVMGAYVLDDLVHAKRPDPRLWGYAALAVAVCLVNPYFLKGALLPFTYLTTLSASSPFKQTIAEFQSPWTMGSRFTTPTVTLIVYKTYSVVFALLLGATIRKRRVAECLLAIVFFALSATALRNIPLFMLLTLPTAAASWHDLRARWITSLHARVLARPAAAWTTIVIVCGFALRAITSAHYIDEARLDRFGVGIDADTQPVRAAEFLVRQRLEGRIINHMNVGGWLDWQRPGQVFIDGRTEVMGDDFYAESRAALGSGGLAQLIAKHRPDILLFNPVTARQWVVDLRSMPDWRLVFVDEAACVFLRQGYATEVPAIDSDSVLTARRIRIPAEGDVRPQLEADGPPALVRFARSFVRPAVHPNGLQAMAIFFQDYRDLDCSEALFLECIRRSGGVYSDFHFNAGAMYYASNQADKARACMRRVLRDDPNHVGAAQILARLQE